MVEFPRGDLIVGTYEGIYINRIKHRSRNN